MDIVLCITDCQDLLMNKKNNINCNNFLKALDTFGIFLSLLTGCHFPITNTVLKLLTNIRNVVNYHDEPNFASTLHYLPDVSVNKLH